MAKKPEWTAEEIAVIKTVYSEHGLKEAAKHLPRRSADSIYFKAYLLGVSAPSVAKAPRVKSRNVHIWTVEEVTLLKDLYPSNGSEFMAAIIGVSESSIITKAGRMGLRVNADARKRTVKKKAKARPVPVKPIKHDKDEITHRLVGLGGWKIDHHVPARSVFEMVPA